MRDEASLGAAWIHGLGMRHLAVSTVQIQTTGRITDDRAVDKGAAKEEKARNKKMKCNVGDWTYVKDGLPENYAGRLWVACRAKDGSRENWVAGGIIYGYYRGTTNPWGIPLLDDDNYEAYAWMYEWYPKPPKEEYK